MSIPVRSPPTTDRRIWRFTKHGFFTVKSAYHRAVQKFSKIHEERAAGSYIHKEWKMIWGIVAIPRVRLFIWRACMNALPTRDQLHRRGVDIDPICVMCGEKVETIDHLLLNCQESGHVWQGSALQIEHDKMKDNTFREFLWTAMHHYPAEYISLMAYNAWEI